MFSTTATVSTHRMTDTVTIHRMQSILVSFLFICLAFTAFGHGEDIANVTQLHILGLYPMTGYWAGGQAQLPATLLAARDINADPNTLPDYEIVITPRDTEVSLFSIV